MHDMHNINLSQYVKYAKQGHPGNLTCQSQIPIWRLIFFKVRTVYNRLESAQLARLDFSHLLESANWKIQSTFQLKKK
jgi:hypothetical protein